MAVGRHFGFMQHASNAFYMNRAITLCAYAALLLDTSQRGIARAKSENVRFVPFYAQPLFFKPLCNSIAFSPYAAAHLNCYCVHWNIGISEENAAEINLKYYLCRSELHILFTRN